MATNPESTNPDQNQQFSCLYFGYASNLSPRTLKQRCPSALYVGLALLKGHKFIITELGFGNIIPSHADDIVYGTLHFLSKRDENALDKSEEVPHWHVKKTFRVLWLVDPKVPEEGREVEVVTYVDVERVLEGVIWKEYIVWMRKAVLDGVMAGVPRGYFERYVNRFLPLDETVGREGQVMMMRTLQMDKEDLGYVPSHVLDLVRGRMGG